jgi:protein subunit release factor B
VKPIPDDLRLALEAAGCDPQAVRETFVRSGGAGGQNVNKVATCVMLEDPRTGIAVKMQEHRTQAANRSAAWVLLLRRLVEARTRAASEKRDEHEAARRRKRPRPGWLKARLVQLKRRRAVRKSKRRAGEGDDDTG